MPEATNNLGNYDDTPEKRDHWRYPAVPEERIRDLAVEFVSKQTGLTETWVQRIHDFQWQLIYDSMTQNKTVLVPKMFRFLMKGSKFYRAIDKLEKQQNRIREKRAELRNKLKVAVTEKSKNKCREAIKMCTDDIRQKEKEKKNWQKLIDTKTREAYASRCNKVDPGSE
jgi:hypothetical protein